MFRFLIASLFIVLSSCGFQLRHHQLPEYFPHTIALTTSTPYSDFSQKLKQQLKTLKLHLKPAKQAEWQLNILSEALTSNLKQISLDSRIRDYTLTFAVTYQVLDRTGHTIQSPTTVQVTRNSVVQANQILGSGNSQMLLEADLHRDAIEQLLLKFARIKPKT